MIIRIYRIYLDFVFGIDHSPEVALRRAYYVLAGTTFAVAAVLSADAYPIFWALHKLVGTHEPKPPTALLSTLSMLVVGVSALGLVFKEARNLLGHVSIRLASTSFRLITAGATFLARRRRLALAMSCFFAALVIVTGVCTAFLGRYSVLLQSRYDARCQTIRSIAISRSLFPPRDQQDRSGLAQDKDQDSSGPAHDKDQGSSGPAHDKDQDHDSLGLAPDAELD